MQSKPHPFGVCCEAHKKAQVLIVVVGAILTVFSADTLYCSILKDVHEEYEAF